jgi:hypothetical protein
MSYEKMWESVLRYPPRVTFRGESLQKIHGEIGRALAAEAKGEGKARLIIRSGRKEDGQEESWAHVKAGDRDVGATNVGVNCPPHPPEECEE